MTTLKVAYVTGDDLLGIIDQLKTPGKVGHLDTAGRDLSKFDNPAISANAYIGMGGIVAALEAGADIVVCGRCCDASPLMGKSDTFCLFLSSCSDYLMYGADE